MTAPFQVVAFDRYISTLELESVVVGVIDSSKLRKIVNAFDLERRVRVVWLQGKQEGSKRPSIRWGLPFLQFVLLVLPWRPKVFVAGFYGSITAAIGVALKPKKTVIIDDGTATFNVARERELGQLRYWREGATFFTLFDGLSFGAKDKVHCSAVAGRVLEGGPGLFTGRTLFFGAPYVEKGYMTARSYEDLLCFVGCLYPDVCYLPHHGETEVSIGLALKVFGGENVFRNLGPFEAEVMISGALPQQVVSVFSTALFSARLMGMKKSSVVALKVDGSMWIRQVPNLDSYLNSAKNQITVVSADLRPDGCVNSRT